jgi:UDP-N-acetylglucosamine transferase subunit ALG13
MSTLLVASTGGHLKELHNLHRRLVGIEGPFRWLTFDTPQSRSLLAGESVRFVPVVGDRDAAGALRSLRLASQVTRERDVKAVVSTGASIAVPYLMVGRMHRRRCLYIESAARIEGPSLSGRMLHSIPGIELYNQCTGWSTGRWRYGGSVYDAFCSARRVGPREIRSAVVALGTTAEEFPRLIRRLKRILPPMARVLWQTGTTDTEALDVPGKAMIPERELSAAMREADVVISHAGVGNSLAALEVGKYPVLVPRRLAFGELVDDHQVQIARELSERDLSLSVDADELTLNDLYYASEREVEMRTSDQMRGSFASA